MGSGNVEHHNVLKADVGSTRDLINDHASFQMISYAPILACLGLYFLIPESPRWLVRRGRMAEAKAELR